MKTQVRKWFFNIYHTDDINQFYWDMEKWFVTVDTAEITKKPGLFKCEYYTHAGCFVFLSPKTYMLYDFEDDTYKRSSKGTPRKCHIALQDFINGLNSPFVHRIFKLDM